MSLNLRRSASYECICEPRFGIRVEPNLLPEAEAWLESGTFLGPDLGASPWDAPRRHSSERESWS